MTVAWVNQSSYSSSRLSRLPYALFAQLRGLLHCPQLAPRTSPSGCPSQAVAPCQNPFLLTHRRQVYQTEQLRVKWMSGCSWTGVENCTTMSCYDRAPLATGTGWVGAGVRVPTWSIWHDEAPVFLLSSFHGDMVDGRLLRPSLRNSSSGSFLVPSLDWVSF